MNILIGMIDFSNSNFITKGDDDTPILAEFEVVRDRTDTTKMGPSRLLCPSPMNIVKTPLLPELNNHNFDAWNQSDDEEQEEPSHNQLYNVITEMIDDIKII